MKSFINKLFIISILSFSVFSLFASSNFVLDCDGDTELHKAVKGLNLEEVKSVLSQYKNKLNKDNFTEYVNEKQDNQFCDTALHLVVRKLEFCDDFNNDNSYKMLLIAKQLLKNGADKYIRNNNGDVPYSLLEGYARAKGLCCVDSRVIDICMLITNTDTYFISNDLSELEKLIKLLYKDSCVIL